MEITNTKHHIILGSVARCRRKSWNHNWDDHGVIIGTTMESELDHHVTMIGNHHGVRREPELEPFYED